MNRLIVVCAMLVFIRAAFAHEKETEEWSEDRLRPAIEAIAAFIENNTESVYTIRSDLDVLKRKHEELLESHMILLKTLCEKNMVSDAEIPNTQNTSEQTVC